MRLPSTVVRERQLLMGGKRRLILVAYGVRENGQREIIDYQLSQSESEANWLKFLTQLRARGLEGKPLKLIVSDGCKGLANAVDIAYPMIKHQLCWAHKMRNILNKVKAADQKQAKRDLRPPSFMSPRRRRGRFKRSSGPFARNGGIARLQR